MYQVENSGTVIKSGIWRRSRLHVSGNVLWLGMTSLFTDISAEMVGTILPVYMVIVLGMTPLEFGIIDGLYQGASALVRLISGLLADRWRRYKAVATLGYALSAGCKLAFLFVGNAWAALTAIIMIDRIGKGIRTAPRDALISLSSSPQTLATAFGVHRALDTAGAMLGPLVAVGLLALAPDAFDAIFVASFCAALIGLGIITLFVKNRGAASMEGDQASAPARQPQPVGLRAAFGLLRLPGFRVLVAAGTALSLATLSDGLLYLGMQRRFQFSIGYVPLLYVITALIYMVLAVPIGCLADRIGRGRVFVAGYALLLLVYTALLVPSLGLVALAIYLGLFGAYYAATDGVLMALASAALPEEMRSSGLAMLATAISMARLCASVLFGVLWTQWGIEAASVGFGLVLLGATVLTALIFFLRRRDTHENPSLT